MAYIFITKGKTNWKYLAIVFILGLIVGAGILWLASIQKVPPAGFPEIKKPEKVEDETANWKSYRNEVYGFEIKYPKNWTIEEETKQNIGSIKEKYRLDIFYPENITEADIWGNIAVEFFVFEDNKKFFDQQLDLMKRDLTLTIEEITIDGVKGFKGVAYQEADKAESMYISQLFPDKENRGVFRISIWTIDLGKKTYQEQANLILSTFRFLE